MFTKDLDVVDFFVVMLAINVGGVFGGVFGLIIMLFSRIFGPNEWILYTIKDAVSICIGGMLTPWFYSIFENNALYTSYAFTVFRWTLYIILTVIFEFEAMSLEISLCTIGSLKSYLYNTFVMKTFEPFLVTVFIVGSSF